MIKPVFDESKKQEFYDWISPRADIETDDYEIIGFVDEKNNTVGAILFCNYDGNNIYVHIAADTPRAVQRRYTKLMFDYIFNQVNCQRVTTVCLPSKTRSKKLIEGVGFKQEGLLKNYLKKENQLHDVIIYGMQREECIWVS